MVVCRFTLAARIHEGEASLRRILRAWPGVILLIVADDDPLFDRRSRVRMQQAFPRARLHTFDVGGHVIPLFHGEEVRRLVGDLARESAAGDQATAATAVPRFGSPQTTPYSSTSRAKIASQR